MPQTTIMEALSSHPIFSALSEESKQLIIKKGKALEVAKNHYIIHEHQKNENIYLLLHGAAKNTFINDEGEATAGLFYQSGDCIGIISAITNQETQFSVQALSDLQLLRISHPLLTELLHKEPIFAEKMVKMISHRLDKLYQKLQQEHSYYAHGLDSFPYRKHIGELMAHPAVVTEKHTSFLELAKTMSNHGVSSLVIVDGSTPVGIVTQKDIIRVIASGTTDLSSLTAEHIMTNQIFTLTPEAFYYEAMLLMVQHRVKHIPVVSSKGSLEGMITMSNLTHARGNAVLSIVDWIQSQTSMESLAQCKQRVHQLLESMIKDHALANEMCSVVTELNDRIQRKIISIAENELMATGIGTAPVDYCWLILGSGGRREQTLGTDQDNAIIYNEISGEEAEDARLYFQKLAEKVVHGLELCGFPRCPGGVMAVNPRWCLSVNDWKKEIVRWHTEVDGEEIRSFTIFLDFRGVYGERSLAETIKDFILTQRSHFILHRLAEDDAEYPIPLGFFGQIVTQKDQTNVINLKHSAVMHIVNAMRILALDKGLREPSTLERLSGLKALGVFSEDEASEIAEAFNYLTMLRIRENIRQIQHGEALSNHLPLKRLTKGEFLQLKKALSTAKWLQQMVARLYHARGR